MKAPWGVFEIVLVYTKPEALDMPPIIMFTRAYRLKSIRSVRAGSSILLVPRVCDLKVQVTVKLGAGEREEMRRHSLKGEEILTANLERTVSTWPLRMPRRLTCAIICFCVSKGKSKRYSLPSGLSTAGNLPLACLLGPEEFALVAHIAGGDGGREARCGLGFNCAR